MLRQRCTQCCRPLLPTRFPHLFPPGPREGIIYSSAVLSATTVGAARNFHDYFVTHLPSSSLHPDRPTPKVSKDGGLNNGIPTKTSSPLPAGTGPEELTVIRIPLRSAKHHFGATSVRGSRPTNEDTYQAGTLEIPAFAKRPPISLNENTKAAWLTGGGNSADGASGDPQIFYFGVFDGHGGDECSAFLRDELHDYVELAAQKLGLETTMKPSPVLDIPKDEEGNFYTGPTRSKPDQRKAQSDNRAQAGKALKLERGLMREWKGLVGGYFARFKPQFFPAAAGGQGQIVTPDGVRLLEEGVNNDGDPVRIETVLQYAFLQADYDFISAQAAKKDASEIASADRALNERDILDMPSRKNQVIAEQADRRFIGGSTCSTLFISTPSAKPFWNPSATCTIVTAHAGDTRIIICNTVTGKAIPLTHNHHPSLPMEETRLRRYSASLMTDSFGEQRIIGLANTRSFGDMPAKRVGVSAEPDVCRVEVGPAEYSFVALVSDGVSGVMSDQEVVDIVKESKTAEEGSKAVVAFAEEVSLEADNCTALIIRLGGWERRSEGGGGSLATKELRDWRRGEALDPRRGRQ